MRLKSSWADQLAPANRDWSEPNLAKDWISFDSSHSKQLWCRSLLLYLGLLCEEWRCDVWVRYRGAACSKVHWLAHSDPSTWDTWIRSRGWKQVWCQRPSHSCRTLVWNIVPGCWTQTLQCIHDFDDRTQRNDDSCLALPKPRCQPDQASLCHG